METNRRTRSIVQSCASPTHSVLLNNLSLSRNFTPSTPASLPSPLVASPSPSKPLNGSRADLKQLRSSTPCSVPRPLPEFVETNNRLFQFRNRQPFHSKAFLLKSPVKSAPPISRVFPHRPWAPEKAHAVSFRDESNFADSAIQSRFYDSDRSELYFEQCFSIEKKMGEGSFGEVMKVQSLDNSKRYAVKRSREKFRNEADRKRKLDEVKKHEQLPKHPNCLQFVKAWEENYRLYIQTELCLMSVQEYWERQGSIPEERVWSILIDLLSGLAHIHKHGFIHLDIKPANIFLSKDGVCKIGDFGLVVDHRDLSDAREGDNKYMAPELLDSVFSTKADVFSLGIAVLELASNMEIPKHGTPWRLLRLGYIPPECVESISHDLHRIIQWMLTPDYEERPNIQDILDHPIVVNRCRRLTPQKIFNAGASLCYAAMSFVPYIVVRVLTLPFSILFRPLSCSSGASHGSAKSTSDPTECKWESTNSNEHRASCSETPHTAGSSHHQSAVFLTPSVKSRSCSRYTPTPRNSSPLATRVKPDHSAENASPDVSPLSHNKSHCGHVGSTGRYHSNLNCFLSDMSDTEDSTCFSESVMVSKPRNLLDMLNNVSDSDD